MIARLLALALALFLIPLIAEAGAQIYQDGRLDVFPREAKKLIPVELSEFVANVAPTHGVESITWDYLESAFIAWITEGHEPKKYEGREEEQVREGLVRIRVRGKPSTMLRQRREEIAWTFSLVTTEPAKFGPRFIRLVPGPPSNSCFGELYERCEFTASDVLTSKRINYRELCKVEFNGHPGIFEIRVLDKQPALLAYFHGGGSGGSSSHIEIHPLKDRDELCSRK